MKGVVNASVAEEGEELIGLLHTKPMLPYN